ncbi:MAG: hypothetical protein HXY43_15895 [Fischerella sp.]|nr:hypothetical protein [Fischerella sp.]
MFSVKVSVFKQLPCLLCVAFITGTCVDRTKNSEIEIAQAAPNIQENIVFPKNAGVIDVTAPKYGAKPNDGKDDTQAIQKALSEFPNQGRIIYLPNGVYDISDTLHWPRGKRYSSDYKRTILQGQSRDGVVIRLKNNSPGFQNPTKPRPVISTGFDPKLDPNSEDIKASRVAQRFGNSVRNLTIKLGKNNYGAEGLNFAAHNQGAVRSVKIISEDRSGTTGLALTHGEVGPLLIEDVEIIGFDSGIRTNTCINSITMQNITVRDQNRVGIFNGGQVISLEGFNSFNSVRAIINGNNPHKGCDLGSTLTLVNAKLIGHGKAKNIPAISSAGFLYARNVVSSGYKGVLANNAVRTKAQVKGSKIEEFTSRPIISQFPSSSRSLQLPIKPFPKLAWDDPKKWVSVEKFGAIPNDKKDDTAAFQAAIDSGATTVFVPNSGNFTINGSLRIRGKVRRFIGTSGLLDGKGEILADNGSEPTLIVENFFIPYNSKLKWKNFANRTVVYRSINNLILESNSTGNLFIDDVSVIRQVRFLNSAQHVWARQLNPEIRTETNVLNRGAHLWILGMKTEQGKTKIKTTNGGFTELLGGLIYANGTNGLEEPLFHIVNASASFSGVADAYFQKKNSRPLRLWVEETRGLQTKQLTRDQIPARMTTNGHVLLLYTGFDKQPNK